MQTEIEKLAADLVPGATVERYVSTLPAGVMGRCLAELGIDREAHKMAIDSVLSSFAPPRANLPLLSLLKEIAEADKIPRKQAAYGVPSFGTVDTPVRAAGNVGTMEALRLAKTMSDQGAYGQKLAILREMMQASPNDWVIDSDSGNYWGISHVRSGWRYHLPARSISDLPLRRASGPAGDVKLAGSADVLRAVATAPANYVKSLAGYGDDGSLKGQRLFDSTTVKPFISRAELARALAAGETREELSKKHQLPSWYHRVPGAQTLTGLVNATDRTAVGHPIVQTARTLNNLLTTPLTRPITRPAEKALLASPSRKARMLGRALMIGDRSLEAATKTVTYGSAGASLAGLVDRILTGPFRAGADIIRTLPTVDGTDPLEIHNPELHEMYKNPLPAVWDSATDDSDLADVQRAISRRNLPYAVANSAAETQRLADTDPAWGAVRRIRQFTLGGNLMNLAVNALADPTPPPTEDIVREEVRKAIPQIVSNPVKNVNSPTGQRLFRLMNPVAVHNKDTVLGGAQ